MKEFLKKILSVKTRRKILGFLNRAWCFFCKMLPLQNRVLFYTIRADGKLLDNAAAVYDALKAKKVVFARKLPHSNTAKLAAYYYLLTSKVIVTDDYVRYLRAVKLRKEQKVFQIWHACGAFKKFGLDAPSKLSPERERASHSQYSAVAVTSQSCRKHYASAFGIDESLCLPTGLPRTDKLINEKENIRKEFYRSHPELENKKIYLYCPTFREVDGSRVVYDPKIDWNELNSRLNDDEVFVIRRHPMMDYPLFDGQTQRIADMSQESTLALIAASDVLITDYSSVIYDACLLCVPIVFYCPDIKEYERGFYLKFPDELPGEMVCNARELPNAIRNAKENPPAERIEKFINGQMNACDGNATKRVVKIIEDWLK